MTWTAHSTVATVVEKDGQFLMVEEKDNGHVVFNQPAGHLDASETLFAAAIRETLEETAWHVQLSHLLGTYVYAASNGITYVRHCFVGEAIREETGRDLDTGIIAAHWLPAETVLAADFPARSPLVAKAIADYQAGIRLPLDSIQHFL